MAKKQVTQSVDKKAIIEAFQEIVKVKNIDRESLQKILEDVFSLMVRKKFGADVKYEIVLNFDKGDLEIYIIKDVVDIVENPVRQISLEEAKLYDETLEIGDEWVDVINFDNLNEVFGRRIVAVAMQTLYQRLREFEKDQIYTEYKPREGEIIVGEVYQVRRNDILVMHNKVEMRLPREEQIPNEPYKFKKNQTIRAIIKEVRRASGGLPDIILSRASDEFLARLFEIEIPEVYEGIIQIKAIARDPGERSKVAVFSLDPRVDPVGACVGMKGVRINAIVKELNDENIDLIEWSDDPKVFIARALSPAVVKDVQIDPIVRHATVIVADDQVPFAIGRNGQNVRLAMKLTGYQITLVKESGEDIELGEFKEELGLPVYNQLVELGIQTAREFLKADPEKILRIHGMSRDTLLEIREIMLKEFDEEEDPEMVAKIDEVWNKIQSQKD
ncbi:MAG: Transcription termination protein NusA [Candidatus Kapaibacterium sp.]|jgi:N utilization substance protein A|nr:MAG: Transcription termination protein NusA [Candidatus Kapabacteria bacterium]ROL56156.1 MAG: transcription termination factor NusA [Bacteroidetes/Chlorobi group bacterium Naka2016]